MKNYEITFITTEDLKEKAVENTIEKFGGKILKTESLGEKQFAYKIEKKTKGFYTSAIFELEPEKVAELNKALTLDEEIIRFLLISAERSDFVAPERYHKETALEKPKTELEIEPPLAMQKESMEIKKETVEPPLSMQKDAAVNYKEEVKKEKKVVKPKIKEVAEKKPAVVNQEQKEIKKDKQVEEITSQEATEEERLAALDKKLDEILKD